jgi:hypothetical protein
MTRIQKAFDQYAKAPDSRGVEFWIVTQLGGYDPIRVARSWTAVDVREVYFDVLIRKELEA